MSILSYFSRFDFASKSKSYFLAEYYLLFKVRPARASLIRRLSEKPIVLGGCARSGTTLLLSILSCHPKILTIPQETGAFCPTAYGASGYNPNPNLDATLNLQLIYRRVNEMKLSPEYDRWCEKTPRNVLYIRRILNLLGEKTRFIQMVRDGRDVITSHHPSDPAEYWVNVQRWVQDVSAGVKYEDHPQVLTVRYEDLVNNYDQVMEIICNFIDVEKDKNLLDFPRAARIKQNEAWFQEAAPINPQSIGRWKDLKYKKKIDELYADQRAVELLDHFRYLV